MREGQFFAEKNNRNETQIRKNTGYRTNIEDGLEFSGGTRINSDHQRGRRLKTWPHRHLCGHMEMVMSLATVSPFFDDQIKSVDDCNAISSSNSKKCKWLDVKLLPYFSSVKLLKIFMQLLHLSLSENN